MSIASRAGCPFAQRQALESFPFPTIPAFPRNEAQCGRDKFEAFASEGEDGTAHFEHGSFIGEYAHLQWSVLPDGVIDGRLSFDGLFGWISLGFLNPGGANNGMVGGEVILALPGGNFTPDDGLDLDLGVNIHEYKITGGNGFVFWSTPTVLRDGWPAASSMDSEEGDASSGTATNVSTSAADAADAADAAEPDNGNRQDKVPFFRVQASECFTSLEFRSRAISGRPFRLDGVPDELMWAANGRDRFVGYHSSRYRDRFAVDWTSGNLTHPYPAPAAEEEEGETSSGYRPSSSRLGYASVAIMAAAAAMVVG